MEKHMKNANQELKIMMSINDKINEILKNSQKIMVDSQMQTDDFPNLGDVSKTKTTTISANSFLNIKKSSNNSSKSVSVLVLDDSKA
jgi:hypothetical protein